MAFDNVITRTGAQSLMPEEHSNFVLDKTAEMSSVMRLARQLPDMTRKQLRAPVINTLPDAGFISGDNSLIPTTDMSWADKYVEAEKLGCIVAVPVDVFDDTEEGLWNYVKPLVGQGLGRAIDRAVYHGLGIPASFTTNMGGAGLVALATAAGQTVSLADHTDMYEALLGETAAGAKGTEMLLEEDGFMSTGHVAHPIIKGKMRNTRDADGNPIFKPGAKIGDTFSTGELEGSEIYYPLNDSIVAESALMISGMWNHLVYAIRRDINVSVATTGTLNDGAGNVTHNLFQQDMVAMRFVMRIGFALPNPINIMNTDAATRCPFAVLTA
jgi:HK97 family phage major capsid protein